ncbi:hypothetical protein H4R27_006518, partial [Coemansia aciculifera]
IMASSTTPSSNVDSTAPNGVQARLPKLSPEFIAQHYPSEAKLLHVHLVHRHGERTPASHPFPNISPRYWNFCAQGSRLYADFAKAVNINSLGSETDKDGNNYRQWHNYMFKLENPTNASIFLKENPSKAHSNDTSQFTADTCAFGQLTDVGRQSLTALGAHMRALYTDALGFLPSVPRPGNDNGPTEDFYLRTTSFSRAFESLQHTLGGMYPNLPANSPLFRINVRPRKSENMYPEHHCKVAGPFYDEGTMESIKLFAEDHAALLKDVLQIPSLREPFEAALKRGATHASYFVLDTVTSMRSHGLPLPKEIDDELIARVANMAAVEYLHPPMISTEIGRMQIGPLVRELADNLVSVVEADRGI